ncbi:MAG: alpha-galactosidase [Clostridia bacterium]|nr:alpha-galactosidase [Clostridia bacterium]
MFTELKNQTLLSFTYDGKPFAEAGFQKEVIDHGNTVITIYTAEDGLKITNTLKLYDDFGACEWVNTFENPTEHPTKILSGLWDCDCTLPMEHEEPYRFTAYVPDAASATKIYAQPGSLNMHEEFYVDVDTEQDLRHIHHIHPGETRRYATCGGRSSEQLAPFFEVHKNGAGYIYAIGWTGQWNCEIARGSDSVTFRSGIENTHFRMLPGESFRCASVVIMPYQGDSTNARNLWRRLVKTHFSLIGKEGRDAYGPLCAGVWGGMHTDAVMQRLHVIKENDLPFEYIWMDAGWYGIDTNPSPDEFEGDWGAHTGDWRVSPRIHPNALKDVTAEIHQMGKKFLLWFEPERVIRYTPIVAAHPEYFLTSENPNDANVLLNLGDEAAFQYILSTLSTLIAETGIDGYRQDFNMHSLPFWRKNDTEDRQGITEIKHINGMYRLWDALLERFPHLLIDNCASGGRRIDIETLRRSMPLWRSDYQCPANFDPISLQNHHIGFNGWMPYSGSGCGRGYDTYRIRSAYDNSMTTNYTFSQRDTFGDDPEKLAWLKTYTEEYLRVRPYFSEDFYPLTEVSPRHDIWCAMQFHRPSVGDGVVQVFRRENAPYTNASYILRGLSPDKTYVFRDADGGSAVFDGKTLLESGFPVEIKERRTAKLYFYSET